MSFILEKEPKLVWKHFDAIRKIPRCSKNESQIRDHIVKFALDQGLEYQVDDAGNLVVRKPASKGMEGRPTVILQGHLDMVCEKNSDKDFDFSNDPIELVEQGEWLTANGTTLGADNGVGVAVGMAMLEDKDLSHGPIEGLFTVDEETGLVGAFSMSPDLVKGRILLNLDSEERGAIFVGCAGGGDSVIKVPLKKGDMPKDHELLEVKVGGLRGGHSGVDIHEQRGNAIKLMARILSETLEEQKLHIVDLKGGSLRNAIPREAFATLAIKGKNVMAVIDLLKDSASNILEEIKPIDPDFNIEVAKKDGKVPKTCLGGQATNKLVGLLVSLPHGVIGYSYDIHGLVETSCNLAVIAFEKKTVHIQMSSRSSIRSALDASRARIRTIATTFGCEVEEPDAYPGWKPNLDSEILKVVKEVYKEGAGKDPELKAIHAGLECGIIGERFPGMDMVSIGPEIKYPHCPEEKVHIGSVAELYDIVAKILTKV